MTVFVQDGRIVDAFNPGRVAEMEVDLMGGEIVRGMISVGSKLGMQEIPFDKEPSTSDGVMRDPLIASIPPILGDAGAAIRAIDGKNDCGDGGLSSDEHIQA